LLTDDAIQRDLDILADDVVQAYKTIDDYKNGHYPHLEYNSERAIYPFIITLEEWFLIGEDLQRLEGKVGSRLSNQKLPETCLTEMPYTICSCRAYEDLVSILRKRTIDDIVETWFVPENKGHHFGQHLLTTYPGEHMSITKLFPREFERILSTNTT